MCFLRVWNLRSGGGSGRRRLHDLALDDLRRAARRRAGLDLGVGRVRAGMRDLLDGVADRGHLRAWKWRGRAGSTASSEFHTPFKTGRSKNSFTLSITPPLAGAGAGAAAVSVLVFSSAIVLGTCAEGRRVHAKVADARARTIDRASRRAVAALAFPSMAWGCERVSRPPRTSVFFSMHTGCVL